MIQINYNDARPIYEKVKEQLRRLILSGALPEDSKLPSVRELAVSLTVNPNTIQRAYRELEAEVYAVAWDENTMFVQHEPMAEVNAQYTKEPHGELDYYILFVSSEELLGPFTLSAFEEACESRGLTIPQEWTPVRNLARQRD